MDLWDFRLPFNLQESKPFHPTILGLELIPGEKRISLRVGGTEGSPTGHDYGAIYGKLFESRIAAEHAAHTSKQALFCWSAERSFGVMFRQGPEVYVHTNDLEYIAYAPTVTTTISADKLQEIFLREYPTAQASDKKQLANEIFCGSFFDTSFSSRFLTLTIAVEVLLVQQIRHDAVQKLIDLWFGMLKVSMEEQSIDQTMKDSIEGSLSRVRKESINQAGRRLARELIPDETFLEKSSEDFFTYSYGIRSALVHDGTIPGNSNEIGELVTAMERFVRLLLIKY